VGEGGEVEVSRDEYGGKMSRDSAYVAMWLGMRQLTVIYDIRWW
jgi:hypothetical protein